MKRFNLISILFFLTAAKTIGQTKTENQPFIRVNGYADTLVVPNEIYISITISENNNKNLSIDEQEDRMIAAIKALNINVEKDLSTSDMVSDFKSRFLKSKDVVQTRKYQLKVSDALMAGKVFATLENLGIVNSSILKVDYSDMRSLARICRTKAMENAKMVAEDLVRPLGQKVGKAIQIIDTNNTSFFAAQNVRALMTIRIANAPKLSKIDFEKIKVQMSENVTFILE